MRQGRGWWGTAPLLVGLGGLALLAFGAPGMEDHDRAKEMAQQISEDIRKTLEVAENAKDARGFLVAEQQRLQYETRGKVTVDLESLSPKKGQELDEPAAKAIADQAYDRVYAALAVPRDPGLAVGERIAFYAGLLVVLAAGVLLYRRTPASIQDGW